MPINFDLEQLREQHGCINYFETGMWDPRSDVSSKRALASNFDKIYCIEIREDFVLLANKIFSEQITSGRYTIFLDDSKNMGKHIHVLEGTGKTMFFLDAHVDNALIRRDATHCPLLEELEGIASLKRKDHVILIDDLRIITTAFPWGESRYGNIDFLEQIKLKILSINPEYVFITLDGHIPHDVLCAYVPVKDDS